MMSYIRGSGGANTVECKIQRSTSWTSANALMESGVSGGVASGISAGIDFPNATGSTTYAAYRRTNNSGTAAICPNINSETEPASIILEEFMGSLEPENDNRIDSRKVG